MVIVVSSDESWAQRLVCNTCRVDSAILCIPNTAAWTPAIWWPEYQEITLKLPSHARTEAQWKVWHASRPVSACQDFCTLGNLHTSSTIAVGDISIYPSDSITGQVGNARLAASLLPVNRLGAWLYYICLSFLVQDCQKSPQACVQPHTCITMMLQQRKIVPSCYLEQKGDLPCVLRWTVQGHSRKAPMHYQPWKMPVRQSWACATIKVICGIFSLWGVMWLNLH